MRKAPSTKAQHSGRAGAARGVRGELFVADMVTAIRGFEWLHTPTASAIDGFIRVRDTGWFIAVQVKSGQSFVDRETRSEYVVRLEAADLEYLRRLSFPLLLIWFDPKKRKAYWAEIDRAGMRRTRVSVPKRHKFGLHSGGDLMQTAGRFFAPAHGYAVIRSAPSLGPKVNDVKKAAWAFYSQWRSTGSWSQAFHDNVQVTLRGWRHLTAAWRTQADAVHKLQLLPIAKSILEACPKLHVCRRIGEGVAERVLYKQTAVVRYGYRSDAIVSVITERLGSGPLQFLSVFEHLRRERGRPVPVDVSLRATAVSPLHRRSNKKRPTEPPRR